jgi:hypothetical protein
LMTRSNLVGCSSRISPGFAPPRIFKRTKQGELAHEIGSLASLLSVGGFSRADIGPEGFDLIRTKSKCPSEKILNPMNRLAFKSGGLIRGGHRCWTPQNRKRYDRSQLRYPSDLTDDEWARVRSFDPAGQARRQQTHS